MRRYKPTIILCILAAVFCLHRAAYAQPDAQIEVGTRAIGMGGAFSAVADDATANFWNPAGLPLLQRQELTSSYSDLFGLGIGNSYLGYSFPITDNQALGVDWNHTGFSDSELDFGKDIFGVSYGYRLHRMFSLGLKGKMNRISLGLDNNTLATASGYGFDGGLIFLPHPKVRAAVSLMDIGGTSVRNDDTEEEDEVLKQRLRGGLAWFPLEGLTVASDLDDRWRLGAEYWLLNTIALRAGYARDIDVVRQRAKQNYLTGGLGIKYKFFRIDYAYDRHPDLADTHRFALSLFYAPPAVSIKSARVKPVPLFRSLYRKYEAEEFAEVELKNASENAIEARVALDVPTMMDVPYEQVVQLPPRTTQFYPIQVSFSDQVLAQEGAAYDNLVQPSVRVSYEQGKRPFEASRNLDPLYVLGKGKLSWDVPARVGAFVTQEDETINEFTRGIVQMYNSTIVDEFNNSNLGRAMVLFNALGKHGIVYQADQQTPWVKIASDSTIFDSVQYPAELLRSRIGDCDDCTVLFASMLENLGIETVLLDVFAPGEGHIYMMFDSGVKLEDVEREFLGESEYVIWDDRVWIPVETTMYGFPFSDAWRNGVEEYRRMKEREYVNEIPVAVAKAEFRSGVVPREVIALPEKEVVDELVSLDVNYNQQRIRQKALAAGVSLDTPEGLYDAAVTYMNFGRRNDARNFAEQALNLNPDFGDAVNLLGVIATYEREYDAALDYYRRALQFMPGEAGIRLNIAITYYLQGARAEAETEYEAAKDMNQDMEGLLKFLEP
jgi:hypothetical protein